MLKKIDKLNKIIIQENSTVQDAINNLNDSKLQIVLVCNSKMRCVGTLTDGDIRRGMLKGLNLQDSVNRICQEDFHYLNIGFTDQNAFNYMKKNNIRHLPVLNHERKVEDLYVFSQDSNFLKENLVFIFAGGVGKRLYPLTANCPKPLLPISGKPILEHIILRLKQEGFYNFKISIGYLGDMIEKYFEDGQKMGINIQYIREKRPLGTAGALTLLQHETKEPILVSNGDVLTLLNYSKLVDFHKKSKSLATMAVRTYEMHCPYGVVNRKGNKLIGFEEKPVRSFEVNAGIYVIENEILNHLKHNKSVDMPDLFNKVIKEGGKVSIFPIHESWIDVGQVEDYRSANTIMNNV